MLFFFIFIVIVVQTTHLFVAFKAHQVIFNQHAQSHRVRYMLGLLPLLPIVLTFLPFRLGVAWVYCIAFACVAPVWYVAHAQYHFFDAKGTALVKPAQNWLSRVETFALCALAYVLLDLLLSLSVVFLAT